jgi:hypothetical protein
VDVASRPDGRRRRRRQTDGGAPINFCRRRRHEKLGGATASARRGPIVSGTGRVTRVGSARIG